MRNRAGPVRRKGERAQTTAEFVLITPFLLLFFFLIVDFGWILKNWIVVTNTAREATRCTIAQSCKLDGSSVTTEQLINARIDAGITGNISGKQIDIRYVDQNGDGVITDGDSMVVCVKAGNRYIAPTLQMLAFVGGVLPNPLPIGAREEMRLELPPATAQTPKSGQCFAP